MTSEYVRSMEDIRNNQAQAVADRDISGAFCSVQHEVSFRRNPDAGAAMQYLVWALKEIEEVGSQKAARHTRASIAALRKNIPSAADKD